MDDRGDIGGEGLFREPASGLIHLASALAAAIGAVVLVMACPRIAARQASLAVYGASLTLLFAASSAYHLVRTTPARELLLRRLDHTAIFLLIAGTYTPVCVIVLWNPLGQTMLAAIWAIAAAGIILKTFLIERIPRWVSVAIYVLMGWLSIVGIVPLVRALPAPALVALIAGGVLYSLGAVIYATKRLDPFPGVFGFHEVWHLFVSAAAAAHYAMMLYVARY
jgi:hemolysin III